MEEKKHPSVLFGYIGNKLDDQTVGSVIGTMERLRREKGFMDKEGRTSVYFTSIPGPYIHSNRIDLLVNRGGIVEANHTTPPLAGYPQVIQDVDLIFIFDWDMAWTFEDFWTLYEACMNDPEPAIYSGVYIRGDGTDMIHMPWTDDKTSWRTTTEIPTGDEPVEVATTGMGFTMFKPEVLKKFPYPWYYRMIHDHDGKVTGIYGEDVAFCLNAGDAGVKSYVHPKVVLAHYKRMLIHPQLAMHQRMLAMQEAENAAKRKREEAKKDKAA